MLSVREQALEHQGTCALDHWFAVAMAEIFEHRMCNELVAPTCWDDYFESELITGVRELNRRSGQRREQHVIADYCDRKRMRCRQRLTEGGTRA
jgi:hypothetical protein